MVFLKSIKGRLLGIIGIALLVSMAVSLTTYQRLDSSMNEYDHVIHNVLQAETLALTANVEFKRQVQEWKNVMIRGADKAKLDKYWQGVNDRHNSVAKTVDELLPLLKDYPELEKSAKQFKIDHQALLEGYAAGREAFITSKFDIAVADKAVSGMDRAPSAALEDISAKLREMGEARSLEVADHAHSSVTNSSIATLIIFLIVVSLTFWLIDLMIVKPLLDVRRSLFALAQGKLHVTTDYHGHNEIGQIAESARQLQAFLLENVATMEKTSQALSIAAEQMRTMSTELESHAGDQMAATEQAATAVQEMTHSANEVAHNSQQTSDITKETTAKAINGRNTANAAQTSTTSLVGELDASAAVIKTLAENASNVASVLDVIRGIAEQTNLLALNAAIEAARAGDLGRGFAVVADEVRTLAQRTQSSTAEIEKILDSVRTGSDQAVIAMDKGQKVSTEVEIHITDANQVLGEIAKMVDEINGKNVQIATAANEQSNVASEISSLIQNIHVLSESTYERVELSQKISGDLKSLIKQFEGQIARFELK